MKTKCIEYAQKLFEMVKKEEGYSVEISLKFRCLPFFQRLDAQLRAEIEKPFKKQTNEINYIPSVEKLLESEAIAESSVRSVLRPNNKFKVFLQNARLAKVFFFSLIFAYFVRNIRDVPWLLRYKKRNM